MISNGSFFQASNATTTDDISNDGVCWDFRHKSEYLDTAFIVEDRLLFASRLVLCMWSPVFRLMLEGDFKEKEMDQIPLPNKQYEDWLEFMKCVHPPMNQTRIINGMLLESM